MTSPNATFWPVPERNSCSELHVPRSLHPTFAGRTRIPVSFSRMPLRETGAISPEGATDLAIDLGEEFRQPVGERSDAEKEQPAVPVEPAGTEEPFRRWKVGLLGEPGDLEGAPDRSGERFPPLDVPVSRGGLGRRDAEGHEPPRLPRKAKPLPEHGMERPDVDDGVVGRGGQDHGVGILPGDGRRRVCHRGGGVPPFRLQEDVPFRDAEDAVGEVRRVLDAGDDPDAFRGDDGEEAPEGLPDHRSPAGEVQELLRSPRAALRPETRPRPARHHHRVIHVIALPGSIYARIPRCTST
jgi:hypothetical protein